VTIMTSFPWGLERTIGTLHYKCQLLSSEQENVCIEFSGDGASLSNGYDTMGCSKMVEHSDLLYCNLACKTVHLSNIPRKAFVWEMMSKTKTQQTFKGNKLDILGCHGSSWAKRLKTFLESTQDYTEKDMIVIIDYPKPFERMEALRFVQESESQFSEFTGRIFMFVEETDYFFISTGNTTYMRPAQMDCTAFEKLFYVVCCRDISYVDSYFQSYLGAHIQKSNHTFTIDFPNDFVLTKDSPHVTSSNIFLHGVGMNSNTVKFDLCVMQESLWSITFIGKMPSNMHSYNAAFIQPFMIPEDNRMNVIFHMMMSMDSNSQTFLENSTLKQLWNLCIQSGIKRWNEIHMNWCKPSVGPIRPMRELSMRR
jgi:hypothetical protein